MLWKPVSKFLETYRRKKAPLRGAFFLALGLLRMNRGERSTIAFQRAGDRLLLEGINFAIEEL